MCIDGDARADAPYKQPFILHVLSAGRSVHGVRFARTTRAAAVREQSVFNLPGMHMLPKLFKAVSKLPDEVLAVHGGDGSCISPVADPASGGTPSSLRDTCLAAALNNARAKNFMARYEPYKIFVTIQYNGLWKKNNETYHKIVKPQNMS